MAADCTGRHGDVWRNLAVGVHHVAVEARLACNQSERVMKTVDISVPSNVAIENIEGELNR